MKVQPWVSDITVAVFYSVVFMLAYKDPSLELFFLLLIIALVNLVQKCRVSLYFLSLVPVFAILQLLIANEFMTDVTSVIWNYSPIESETYYMYAIPLVYCYTIPFFYLGRRGVETLKERGDTLRAPNNRVSNKLIARELIVIGLVSELAFIFVRDISIVGALITFGKLAWHLAIPMYLFDLKKYIPALLLFLYLVLGAWQSTLYWDLYMVVLLTIIYGWNRGKLSWAQIGVSSTIFLILVVSIQSLKSDIRSGDDVAAAEVGAVAVDFANGEGNERVLVKMFGRLNQGIHDSFVYHQIEESGKSSNSILESVLGTFLPRFLFPNKPTFSSDKFVDFTGYTGMGYSFISLSGCAESASNFGLFWGCLFLLFWGFVILNWAHFQIEHYTEVCDASIISFIPFYHVIRVEVDFFHWTCGLVYGFIVVWVIMRRLGKTTGVHSFDGSKER